MQLFENFKTEKSDVYSAFFAVGDGSKEENYGPSEPLLADIRAIRRMEDLQSDLGYARAFVRLALEKKVLSAHLKLLLTGTNISRVSRTLPSTNDWLVFFIRLTYVYRKFGEHVA